ncbi:MAG: excinuclease ABC subunit UvrC [Candidatus Hydrogenedentes bacterium]|nr:excinuclease ABC subunit UvrC [Candidatus Hydrogenedentota bacterium]
MESAVTSIEHLELGTRDAAKQSAEEFAASFDVTRIPTAPGCYLMRDEQGTIIYVGKAKNLRARVRSYVNESDERFTVKFLMQRVANIDFLVTTTDKEAVLLENSLIKQHKPRYNLRLKDDKTYVSLKMNLAHDFPRLTVTRKYRKDGSRYFGPYSSAHAVRETLRQLQRVFPLRTCTDAVLSNRVRPCLYHQMKQCCAPCVGYVDKEAYREIVSQVMMVLEGRSDELDKLLRKQIEQHAENLDFEKAAELRDRLFALQRTLERQRTVQVSGVDERDVVGIHTHGRYSEIQLLFFRGNKMIGGRSFSFNQREMPVEELLSSFLLQYYSEAATIPGEVLLPLQVDDADVLEELLSEHRGARVSVHWPQRGEKKALLDMANRNAESGFAEKRLKDRANKDLLEQIKDKLKLSKTPKRIECFDISTTQGDKAVGSMVVFQDGEADKSRYRRFAIKQVEGQDDFAMMREVLLRRYKRAIEEDDLPDLALIDGGKGQLGVAVTALEDLGIEDLDTISIAKSRHLGEGVHSPERFFLPGRANPVILPQNSPVVHLLARIRDEAHRFAITYHRKRRNKATLKNPLIDVPGIGPKRARTLLRALGSMAKVREAPVEAIAALPGFNEALALQVKQHLAIVEG